MWLFLSLCWDGIQVQHPQMLQRLAESCHQVNNSHRYGVTTWSGVIQWLTRTDISHCLQLPCARGVYLSLHNRACMHLGRDVRTWLSREWSLARNHLEMHLEGLDSVVSLCRLSRHLTVNTYIEAEVCALIAKWVCRNAVTTEGSKVWGENGLETPGLAQGSREQWLAPYIMYLFFIKPLR